MKNLIWLTVSVLLGIFLLWEAGSREIAAAREGAKLYIDLSQCPMDRKRSEYRCD